MEREHMDEVRRVREEVADVLAATLLDMILAGDGPDAKTECRADQVEDQERRSCH